jgi:hypothetical protein
MRRRLATSPWVTRAIQGNGNPRTLRLRFAEVDNQGFLNIGIDYVNFVAGFGSTTGVPALDWRGLMLLATLLATVAAFFARRQANQAR